MTFCALLRGDDDKLLLLHAPDLIQTEVLNAIAVACLRRKRISQSLLEELMDEFTSFELLLDSPQPFSYSNMVELMARHGLSAYDARYLELALRIDQPLATLDRRLAEAAAAEGVSLVC